MQSFGITPEFNITGRTEFAWSRAQIEKLIKMYKAREDLWNIQKPLYKDRAHKVSLQMEIATAMGIDHKDVVAKIHNLRCQYNAEIRKMKQRKKIQGAHYKYHAPRWEFFKSLSFLINAYGTFKVQFHPFEKKQVRPKSTIEEQELHTPIVNAVSNQRDAHQIFGDYIAEEMRGMTDSQRKRVKIAIHKVLLEVAEESHDTSTIASAEPSPLSISTQPIMEEYAENIDIKLEVV